MDTDGIATHIAGIAILIDEQTFYINPHELSVLNLSLERL